MVTKYRTLPASYEELIDFLQCIATIEATFGFLKKSISHLIEFAKKQEADQWSLIEELCFNKTYSEAVKVMSQPASRTSQRNRQ
jgi:hypothetical protein